MDEGLQRLLKPSLAMAKAHAFIFDLLHTHGTQE